MENHNFVRLQKNENKHGRAGSGFLEKLTFYMNSERFNLNFGLEKGSLRKLTISFWSKKT